MSHNFIYIHIQHYSARPAGWHFQNDNMEKKSFFDTTLGTSSCVGYQYMFMVEFGGSGARTRIFIGMSSDSCGALGNIIITCIYGGKVVFQRDMCKWLQATNASSKNDVEEKFK